MYLVAVFIPPLYFMMKKKWLASIVTSLLLVLSLFLTCTFVFIPVALLLWGLSAVVAVWDVRKALMHEHATLIAEKLAAKMQQSSLQPSAWPPTSPS